MSSPADAAPPVWTLEFADSEVKALHAAGRELRVVFAAAFVRAPAAPGHAPALGWLSGVELVFSDATADGPLDGAFGRIADGLWRRGAIAATRLPVPTELEGPLGLELHFANGARVSLSAGHLVARLPEAPRFVESLAC
jgi:hypothetical protein